MSFMIAYPQNIAATVSGNITSRQTGMEYSMCYNSTVVLES